MLLISFLESFATICVERGVYFYSTDRFKFDAVANLWLALALGVPYVVGALSSHRLCNRRGERTILLAAIAAQAACHLMLAFWPGWATIFACTAALGFLNGAKWPVLESYISAGRGHRDCA